MGDGGSRAGRIWFAVTALLVLAGVVIQTLVAAGNEDGYFSTVHGRVFNVFCFFTVQSNLLVGVGCGLLALRTDRSSLRFAVLRLTSLVAITITGLVYWIVLADLSGLRGWALVADLLLHTAVPILALLGWLRFGPRGTMSSGTVWWSLAFPLCWLAFTLIRGPITGFYPYPFVDVDDLGYARVLLNCALIAVLYVGLAFGAMGIDRRLAAGRRWAARRSSS